MAWWGLVVKPRRAAVSSFGIVRGTNAHVILERLRRWRAGWVSRLVALRLAAAALWGLLVLVWVLVVVLVLVWGLLGLGLVGLVLVVCLMWVFCGVGVLGCRGFVRGKGRSCVGGAGWAA